jgi:radical SAM-linked protein
MEREPALAPGQRVQPKHMRPPPKRATPSAPPARVRLVYQKVGTAAYRGHLDLVKLLPRVLRRAGLALHYTEGFHPRPDLVFGPALPLGTASLAEYLDVRVDSSVAIDIDTLAARLDAVSEAGLRFTHAALLGAQDPGVNKVIDEALYVVGIPEAVITRELASIGVTDVASLAARIAARLAEGSLVVRRDLDGIGKDVDVSRWLVGATVDEGAEYLAEAGIGGALVPIALRIRVTGQGTAKAAEAIEALLGVRDVPLRVVRAKLLARRGEQTLDPLSLEALRARPPASQPAATEPSAEA